MVPEGGRGVLLSASPGTRARSHTSPCCRERRHVHVSVVHCVSLDNLHISRRESSQLTLQACNSLIRCEKLTKPAIFLHKHK